MDSAVYKAMYEREGEFWWHKGMNSIAAALLRKYLKPSVNLKILDAGCGTGGAFRMLAEFGKVTGVDESEQALSYARQRKEAEVLHAQVEDLPFENESFDLIACFDVLYHQNVGSDERALAEFSRVLKPGGFLIVREASYDWLRSRHDQIVWTKHRYSKKELVAKLEKTKFRILKASYVMFFLLPFAIAARVFEKILPPRQSAVEPFTAPRFFNFCFFHILRFESWIVNKIKLPCGLSIFCLAKKIVKNQKV